MITARNTSALAGGQFEKMAVLASADGSLGTEIKLT
jgi:hypothetical protein